MANLMEYMDFCQIIIIHASDMFCVIVGMLINAILTHCHNPSQLLNIVVKSIPKDICEVASIVVKTRRVPVQRAVERDEIPYPYKVHDMTLRPLYTGSRFRSHLELEVNNVTFGVEMRSCGQNLVKFCTLTHTHIHTHTHTHARTHARTHALAAKLVLYTLYNSSKYYYYFVFSYEHWTLIGLYYGDTYAPQPRRNSLPPIRYDTDYCQWS